MKSPLIQVALANVYAQLELLTEESKAVEDTEMLHNYHKALEALEVAVVRLKKCEKT